MSASDLDTEKAGGEMQGRTGAPDVPGPPSDEVLSAQPLPTRARAHTRARPVLLLTLLAAIATWFAYDSAQQTPAARTPANGIAMDAAGGWWNVAGDRYLGLDWEGRRATLWDYSASDSGVESTGTWRATDQTVVVEVSGDAGSLTQEYEVVGSDAELFLAPAPASTAKLFDSWIADHGGQDDEDVGPGHSVSHEAAWRPHHHARPHHPRHSHSPHSPAGFGA
jgi:hypothetical protein